MKRVDLEDGEGYLYGSGEIPAGMDVKKTFALIARVTGEPAKAIAKLFSSVLNRQVHCIIVPYVEEKILGVTATAEDLKSVEIALERALEKVRDVIKDTSN